MKKWLAVLVSAVATSACLATASSAAAATEFGDSCSAEVGSPSIDTLTTLSDPSSGLSITAPTSGVITKVKIRLAPSLTLPLQIPGAAELLRSAGGAKYTVSNETEIKVGAGLTETEARMPVQAGERLAFRGLPFSYSGTSYPGFLFYCAKPEAVLGISEEPTSKGSTTEFYEDTDAAVPLVATIEPDADGDGYGDETQDKCPQSATTQAPCPTVVLNTSASAKGSFITVVVTSTVQASVTVAGTVKLGKGKTAKLSGGTQVVAPGALAKFTVPFTGKLKSALKKLSRKQKLKLKLTASAPNVVGSPTVKKATVTVKGQARPKPHKKS